MVDMQQKMVDANRPCHRESMALVHASVGALWAENASRPWRVLAASKTPPRTRLARPNCEIGNHISSATTPAPAVKPPLLESQHTRAHTAVHRFSIGYPELGRLSTRGELVHWKPAGIRRVALHAPPAEKKSEILAHSRGCGTVFSPPLVDLRTRSLGSAAARPGVP